MPRAAFSSAGSWPRRYKAPARSPALGGLIVKNFERPIVFENSDDAVRLVAVHGDLRSFLPRKNRVLTASLVVLDLNRSSSPRLSNERMLKHPSPWSLATHFRSGNRFEFSYASPRRFMSKTPYSCPKICQSG